MSCELIIIIILLFVIVLLLGLLISKNCRKLKSFNKDEDDGYKTFLRYYRSRHKDYWEF